MIYDREVSHRGEMFRLSSPNWGDGLAWIIGKPKCPFDEKTRAEYDMSTVDAMQKMMDTD
jgi:hypothetical protein